MPHRMTPASLPVERRRRLRLLLPALLTIAALSSPLHADTTAPAAASDAVDPAVPAPPPTDHVRFGLR